MKRLSSPLLPLLLLLVASPAWAIQEWYDYYRDAEASMRREQYQEALRSLQEAVRLRKESGLNVRTYGMTFVDYFPYYQQGVCYLRLSDENSAIRMFNIEESQGAIRGTRLYGELVRLREQAQAQVQMQDEATEKQRRVRRAGEEVERLRREGSELHRDGKYEEALARLAQAEKAAEVLEPAVRQQVADQVKRIRAEQNERAERAATAQKIEDGLARGNRLLEQEKAAEARIAFDSVLALDPRNTVALDGKREAEAHILAETTQQERDAAFRTGKSLFEAGQYEQALEPLTKAAADATNHEAAALLDRAQKTVARMKYQKDLRMRIDSLLAEGERLIALKQFPEAVVKLRNALELDKDNTLVKERLGRAEAMTRDEMAENLVPNKPPVLSFTELPPTEMEGSKLKLRGWAFDDRGIARVEFRSGPRIVGEYVLAPQGQDDELPATFRIEQEFELEAGLNDISVVVTDIRGKTSMDSFRVRRRLRFYETRAFWPSAVAVAAGLIGIVWLLQRERRQRAMRSRFNPYIAGAPVMTEDLFFGRQKLLARILNVLHHNSLLITGERRIGKTTFLYHLRKALAGDDQTGYRFFPVFTDLQGVPEEAFFHTIMSDIVESLGLKPETLAALRFGREETRYDGRDFSHDLQRVIDELKTRTPQHVKLAMLVDEVDVLNEYSERVNQRLRSIFMKTFSEHLVAIMSGVGIKRLWTSEGSPWYNFFDEIELSAFSREEAEALIREPVEGVFRYEATAVAAILDGSELKPYVIQKFCIHAVNRMLEAGRTTVTAADVDAVRDEVLREGRDVTPEDAALAHASA